MKLLSSIRELSRVFWKDGDKETFFLHKEICEGD